MTDSLTRPDLDEIRTWLGEVPDPEVPAVSVMDLGIVRDVRWDGDELVVAITPTYSGCPATSVIAARYRDGLAGEGDREPAHRAATLAALDDGLDHRRKDGSGSRPMASRRRPRMRTGLRLSTASCASL